MVKMGSAESGRCNGLDLQQYRNLYSASGANLSQVPRFPASTLRSQHLFSTLPPDDHSSCHSHSPVVHHVCRVQAHPAATIRASRSVTAIGCAAVEGYRVRRGRDLVVSCSLFSGLFFFIPPTSFITLHVYYGFQLYRSPNHVNMGNIGIHDPKQGKLIHLQFYVQNPANIIQSTTTPHVHRNEVIVISIRSNINI